MRDFLSDISCCIASAHFTTESCSTDANRLIKVRYFNPFRLVQSLHQAVGNNMGVNSGSCLERKFCRMLVTSRCNLKFGHFLDKSTVCEQNLPKTRQRASKRGSVKIISSLLSRRSPSFWASHSRQTGLGSARIIFLTGQRSKSSLHYEISIWPGVETASKQRLVHTQ